MAQSNTCDLCGLPAVDTIELKSKTVTNVTKDVCEEHLALFKSTSHFFTGQKELPLEHDGEYSINLVTNGGSSNLILIFAEDLQKKDYQTLIVDGKEWALPDWLSFADVDKVFIEKQVSEIDEQLEKDDASG